jgi:hypothetical protein
MSLIEQWANNIGAIEPVNGSWLIAIASSYNARLVNSNLLLDIAIKLNATDRNGDLYQSIAIQISKNQNITPLNGSWLERIVQLTSKR